MNTTVWQLENLTYYQIRQAIRKLKNLAAGKNGTISLSVLAVSHAGFFTRVKYHFPHLFPTPSGNN